MEEDAYLIFKLNFEKYYTRIFVMTARAPPPPRFIVFFPLRLLLLQAVDIYVTYIQCIVTHGDSGRRHGTICVPSITMQFNGNM